MFFCLLKIYNALFFSYLCFLSINVIALNPFNNKYYAHFHRQFNDNKPYLDGRRRCLSMNGHLIDLVFSYGIRKVAIYESIYNSFLRSKIV